MPYPERDAAVFGFLKPFILNPLQLSWCLLFALSAAVL